MFYKILSVLIIIGFIIGLVLIFWQNSPVLTGGLLLIAVLKHKLLPIKNERLTFMVCAVLGTSSESIMMLSGAWFYSSPQVFNFPLWLPFLWGLAGTIFIAIYQSILSKKSLE